MSRPGVPTPFPRRSRLQPTLDFHGLPPKDAELAADIMRGKTRLPQRTPIKASAAYVANRQEAPLVSRQPRQRASPLESRESPLKTIRQRVPAPSDRVLTPFPRRSRPQPTLDMKGPPTQAPELAADIMRVEVRLPQRAAVKASSVNVARRQEAPPVARQSRQRASPLEIRESPVKIPARPDRVLTPFPGRSRLQPMLDFDAPPPPAPELAADTMRVEVRLPRRAAVKEANVTKGQETPRVPRVTPQSRQRASPLESRESPLKTIRHVITPRSDRVLTPFPRRSRLQPTLEFDAPPPKDAELAAGIMRGKTRLPQRTPIKASAAYVAKRQETPRVPRVTRQLRQRASPLESRESSLKIIRQRVSAPSDRVLTPFPHRSQLQPTLDVKGPRSLAPELAADIMRVEAQLPRPATVKAPAARVAKHQEAPRVARQLRQRASPLESRDSPLKIPSEKPKIEPAGRWLTPRPTDFLVIAPMAPRATRFRAVDVSPMSFSLPRTPKVALKPVLRGGIGQRKRREPKRVSFGHVETKEVEKWIGILQGTESDNQLFYEGTRCRGKNIHVYPDPCRVVASNLVGWTRRGADDDWDYVHLYGPGLVSGAHSDCPNSGCNRNFQRVR